VRNFAHEGKWPVWSRVTDSTSLPPAAPGAAPIGVRHLIVLSTWANRASGRCGILPTRANGPFDHVSPTPHLCHLRPPAPFRRGLGTWGMRLWCFKSLFATGQHLISGANYANHVILSGRVYVSCDSPVSEVTVFGVGSHAHVTDAQRPGGRFAAAWMRSPSKSPYQK